MPNGLQQLCPTELSVITETVSSRAAQNISHWPNVAAEHLRCGQHGQGTEFSALLTFHESTFTWTRVASGWRPGQWWGVCPSDSLPEADSLLPAVKCPSPTRLAPSGAQTHLHPITSVHHLRSATRRVVTEEYVPNTQQTQTPLSW